MVSLAILSCALTGTALMALDLLLHGNTVIAPNAYVPLSLLLFFTAFDPPLSPWALEFCSVDSGWVQVAKADCSLLLAFPLFLDLSFNRHGVDVPLLMGVLWFLAVTMVLQLSFIFSGADSVELFGYTLIVVISIGAMIGAIFYICKLLWISTSPEALRLLRFIVADSWRHGRHIRVCCHTAGGVGCVVVFVCYRASSCACGNHTCFHDWSDLQCSWPLLVPAFASASSMPSFVLDVDTGIWELVLFPGRFAPAALKMDFSCLLCRVSRCTGISPRGCTGVRFCLQAGSCHFKRFVRRSFVATTSIRSIRYVA